MTSRGNFGESGERVSLSPRGWSASWGIVPALALGAAAIVQVVVVPQLRVRGVYPDLILLLVIARSLIVGRRDAVVWGFVGGLWMDLFSGDAIGASCLALMATALLTGTGHSAVFRRNIFVPTIATLAGSLAFSLLYTAILTTIGYRFPFGLLMTKLILPVAVYNGAVMFLATPLLNRLPEQADSP